MDTTLTDRLVGRVLDGRYRIETRIARGGMASVYAATDTRLERTVAVKVMHAALADDREFVARFIREAHAAARLSHPNVVAVYDQGADGDCVFLVMEYVAGHTLRDLLREQGRLRHGAALAVAEPVLAALAAAHDAGLVHRDVKPENVLIAPDGRVKVADFGLARAVAEATLTGTAGVLIGTVAYLAPEQVEHGTADARSDVYAAGVMLFEMLTGRAAFEGETPLAVAYRHVHEDVPAPSTIEPTVPQAVDELVLRATARDPFRRPVDAGALLVAVASVRDELGCTDRVPLPSAAPTTDYANPTTGLGATTAVVPDGATRVLGPAPAAPVPARRRRWPFVVIPLAIAAVLAGALGWWFGAGRYVNTPGLLDDTWAQASAVASHEGLHLRQGPAVYSDAVRRGAVATQSPLPNRSVRRGGLVTVDLSLGVEAHPVPTVTNETPAQAAIALAAVKLVVGQTSAVYDPAIRAGRVIGTRPAAGTVLRHGSAVTLLVSKGPQPVAVPNVRGEPLEQATQVLTQAGFVFTTPNSAYSDTVPKGAVMAESPAAGTLVPPGSTIALTISRGAQTFPVPNVVGMPVDAAVALLERDGFVASVSEFPGGPGDVLSQNPSGGTPARHGATVLLYAF